MTKQATFGSLMEGFNTHLKAVASAPVTKTAADEAGRSEKSVAKPKSDAEITAALPNGGQEPADPAETVSDRGVVSGESLPNAPKNIPTVGLKRSEQSPSTKLSKEAAAGSIDELVARLTGNLKLASEGKTQQAQKPPTTEKLLEKAPEPEKAKDTQGEKKVELPTSGDNKLAEAAPAGDIVINVDELAQKTAEFLRYSELGYEMSKALFSNGQENVKTAVPALAINMSNEELAAMIDSRAAELKTAGLNDEQIEAQLELDGQSFAQAKQAEALIVDDTRNKIANYIYDTIAHSAQEGALTIPQAEYILTKLGFANPQAEVEAELRAAVEQKIASLVAEGKTEAEIAAILQKDAEADAAALEAAAAPEAAPAPEAGGAPDEAQLAQTIHAAISELEQAVQAGQLTEEQAVQLLEQSGLDVNALLAAANDGGAPEGAPGHEASESPAEEKAEGKEKPKEEKSEKPEKKDEPKEEKKEAAELPPEAAPAGAPGLENLPPEVQQILQEIDQLLQSGQITEDQAMQAVTALLQGGAGAGAEGAPSAAPSDAGVPAGAGATPVA